MKLVVDASVVVKWYVVENFVDEAEFVLDGRFERHAPELLIPEFGNIMWKKYRNKDVTEDEALKICKSFVERDITFHSHLRLLSSAVVGSIRTEQTVYDWTYLALAVSLGCKLVTADRRFYSSLQQHNQTTNLLWIEDIRDV